MSDADFARQALLRTLAFHAAWGYPPTAAEAAMETDIGPRGARSSNLESRISNLEFRIDSERVWEDLEELKREGKIVEQGGRLVLRGQEKIFSIFEERQPFVARKLRAARRAARTLARLGGVRFVALGNTTALNHARDEGDLDLFVIARRGGLAQVRVLVTAWYKLLGRRPGDRDSDRDSACLSFFIDDLGLDLSSCQLPIDDSTGRLGDQATRRRESYDDPYFRYWFLSLLPLYDDGIMKDFWAANSEILARHPLSRAWLINKDIEVIAPKLRMPVFGEKIARKIQDASFNRSIRERMNKDTTVVVNDHVLKFHVDDGRERYRSVYREMCAQYGVEP